MGNVLHDMYILSGRRNFTMHRYSTDGPESPTTRIIVLHLAFIFVVNLDGISTTADALTCAAQMTGMASRPARHNVDSNDSVNGCYCFNIS